MNFSLSIYLFICHETGIFAYIDKWVVKVPGVISLLIVKYKCALLKCSILTCTGMLWRIKMSYIMLRSSAFERSTYPYFSKMEEHH